MGNATTASTNGFIFVFEFASHHAIGVPVRRRIKVVKPASFAVNNKGAKSGDMLII